MECTYLENSLQLPFAMSFSLILFSIGHVKRIRNKKEMGNCLGHPPDSPGPQANIGRASRHRNSRLLQGESNSTFHGQSSSSFGHSTTFGPSSCNTYTKSNTSTSILGFENSQTSQVRGQDGQILDAANLRVFNLAELKTATRNFRADTILGEGSFGTVYKGLLRERTGPNNDGGLVIAVKRMDPASSQGIEEWLTEVNFLGRFSHPNLIKLLGFGRENEELMLVYEFMQRGSLANHLFGRGANVHPLTWDTRLKVMIGAARGLCFLHSFEKKIIHRDLKPSNILLDRSFNAKLTDFGLAKENPSGDITHVTTRVVGSYGYAAPEYMATGHLTAKCDVYSFGVVLVEILTGKRMFDIIRQQHGQLVDWLKSTLLSRRQMRGAMDPRLEGKYPPNLALPVAQLTLKCIQTESKLRPSMAEVVETLEQIEEANVERPSDNRKHATHSRPAQLHGRPHGS